MKAAGTVKSIWAEVNSAPSSGVTWQVTVRKNGLTTAGNSLSCTISGPSATACETSGSVIVADGDFLTVFVSRTAGSGNDRMWKTYVVLG